MFLKVEDEWSKKKIKSQRKLKMEDVDSINQHKDGRALFKMRGSGCDYSLRRGVQRKG